MSDVAVRGELTEVAVVKSTTALERSGVQALRSFPSPDEMNLLIGFANKIANVDGFVPRPLQGKPAAIFACMMKGLELGLQPMTALSEIYMVDGRPSLSAALTLAKLREGGVEVVWDDNQTGVDDERAWITARRGTEEGTVEFTFEEASKITYRTRDGSKKLVEKDNWVNYRRDMLWARCAGRLARRFGSDLLHGLVHTREELLDSRGTIDAEVVEEPEAAADGGAQVTEVPDETPPVEPAGSPDAQEKLLTEQYDALNVNEIRRAMPEWAARESWLEAGHILLEHELATKNRSTVVELFHKHLPSARVGGEGEPRAPGLPEAGSGDGDEGSPSPNPQPEGEPVTVTEANEPEQVQYVDPDGTVLATRGWNDGLPSDEELAGWGVHVPEGAQYYATDDPKTVLVHLTGNEGWNPTTPPEPQPEPETPAAEAVDEQTTLTPPDEAFAHRLAQLERIDAFTKYIEAHHPDEHGWTRIGLLRVATKTWPKTWGNEKPDTPYESFSELTDEQLGKIVAGMDPEVAKQAFQEAGLA